MKDVKLSNQAITIKLVGATQRTYAKCCIEEAPDGFLCIVKKATRSLEQNALMWSHLTDLSNQVEWYGRMMTPENWKAIITAALCKYDCVPGIDPGTIVVLGQETSKMNVSQLNDLIELTRAFGADKNVRWTI